MKLLTTPYKYQEEGISFLLKHHYSILGDDMGLGKSLQAIGVCCETKARKILVVCPAYLKVNWVNEFKTHTDCTEIFMMKKKGDSAKPDCHVATVTIAGYEMVEELNFCFFDIVIADECQYLKNFGAKRTVNFHANFKDVPPDRLILLSGTPIKNRIPEFYSLLVLCGYNPFKDSGIIVKDKFKTEWSFSKYFCNLTTFRVGHRHINKFSGLKNKETLKKLLKDKFMRRLSKDVLELPEMVEKNVMLSFNTTLDERKMWDQFLLTGMNEHISSRKAESAFLKSKFTIKYVRDLLNDGQGPIVVFCDHVKSTKVMAMELDQFHRVKCITGDVPSEVRGDYVQQFQNGQLDVLVCTIGAASTGFTLTKSTNLVFNSYPWVGADLSQAKKRIHRIGQKNRVTIHYILGSPVDEDILNKVKSKETALKEIL